MHDRHKTGKGLEATAAGFEDGEGVMSHGRQRPLEAGNGSQLKASKKMGASVLQQQETARPTARMSKIMDPHLEPA